MNFLGTSITFLRSQKMGVLGAKKKILQTFLSFAALSPFLMTFCATAADDFTNCGKIDVAPTVMRVELLECGKREKKMDMYGIRGELCHLIKDGWLAKPIVVMGWGEGALYMASLAFGRCIPIGKNIILTPQLGFCWSYLTTTIDIPLFMLKDVNEKFRATSPFVALEITYNFWDCWRVSGCYQYGWSRSWTKVEGVHECHTNTKGPNYALQVERDFNDKWSINVGGAYYRSLSKEKHGLRGKGLKLGIVYWY